MFDSFLVLVSNMLLHLRLMVSLFFKDMGRHSFFSETKSGWRSKWEQVSSCCVVHRNEAYYQGYGKQFWQLPCREGGCHLEPSQMITFPKVHVKVC